jgi:hypothetical protein
MMAIMSIAKFAAYWPIFVNRFHKKKFRDFENLPVKENNFPHILYRFVDILYVF